jgi:DNA-binding transcriptional LysR family regulator
MARRPIRTPDIAELRAFCAAADLGTLGRAAIALGVSQPALSKRLRALEAAAGGDLLTRSPTGVTLTATGRRLYPEARRLLDQAEVVDELLEGAGGEPAPIRLAVSPTIAEFYLPHQLVAYQADGARHPPVELTVANSNAVRRMVRESQVEIAISASDPSERSDDGLDELELLSDEVIVAVPQAHAWYRRKSVPLRSLISTALVMRDPEAHDRRCFEAVLAERGLQIAEPLVEVGSTAVAKREALERSAPVLLSALSLSEPRDRLYRRPVAGVSFPRRFMILCRSLASLPRAERDFIAFLRRDLPSGSSEG